MKEVSPAIRAIPALPVFVQVLEKSRYRISPIAGPMGDFGSLEPTALRHRIASWFAHCSVQSFHFAFIFNFEMIKECWTVEFSDVSLTLATCSEFKVPKEQC